jgi:hypothetical protein
VRLRRDTEMQTIGTVDLLAKEATGIILPRKNTVCQTYLSFSDCLTALRAGEIDAYYTYTYQAERLLYDNLRNDLTTTLTDHHPDRRHRGFCHRCLAGCGCAAVEHPEQGRPQPE